MDDENFCDRVALLRDHQARWLGSLRHSDAPGQSIQAVTVRATKAQVEEEDIGKSVSALLSMGLQLYQIQLLPEPLAPERRQEYIDLLAKMSVPETLVRKRMAQEGCTRHQIEQLFAEHHRGHVKHRIAESTGTLTHLPQLPPFWMSRSLYPGGALGLSHIAQSYCLPPLTEGSVEFAALQKLLVDTYKAKKTRDREGKVASRYELVAAFRVENALGFQEYLGQREVIKWECSSANDFAPVQKVLTAGADLPGKEGDQALDAAGANEHYLFHGTDLKTAISICAEDFCVAFAAKTGMYGPGIYFAESISKSDEYCVEEEVEVDGRGHALSTTLPLCTVLLCRVAMGKVLVDRHKDVDSSKLLRAVEGGKYNGVLGDREAVVGTYREFVVYHEGQACVEYLLRFRRVFE